MSRSRAKGTRWESECVTYLREHGHPYVERRAMRGRADCGDIAMPGVVLECKAERQITLAAYMDEVEVEKRNAGVPLGFAIVKRRNHGVARAYFVCELAQGARLLSEEG